MKNPDKWQPSKYVFRRGKLIASRDPAQVNVGSRLTADLTAAVYQQYLPKYAQGKLLDLGCGNVPLFQAYRDYVTDNICVDWHNSPHPGDHLDFACDLTKPLPFKDAEFDTIILSDVLEHIPQPQLLFQEMARILSEHGHILMNVPFFYGLHEQPHDYYRFTEFALRRFVSKSSLELIILTPLGGSPEILADICAKHIQFIPLIGKCLAAAIQSATQLLARTSLGKRISEKTSQVFPLGYFLIAEKNHNVSLITCS